MTDSSAGPAFPSVPHWPGGMVDVGGGERVWLVRTTGSADRAEPVLCLHGMSGASANWTDLMTALAPDFDCAAVDLPGSGLSPPPRQASGYSIRALAAVVIRLIEVLSGESGKRTPVHLIGNSMGGAIAIRVAASRPDLVQTLTLISPALPDRRVSRATAHFPVISLPFAGEWLVHRYVRRLSAEERVEAAVAACFYDPGSVRPEQFDEEVEALRRRDKLSHDAASLVGAARTLTAETLLPHRFSLWRAAELVSAPALVLFGSHDRLVSPRLAAPASRAFRGARVLVLPRTGHIAQMERPALVAAYFREMVGGSRARGIPDSVARLRITEVTTT